MGSGAATAVERTGCDALILLLRFHAIAADPAQVRHRYGAGRVWRSDTFNFTKCGLLHGKVLSASGDPIQRDKPPAAQPSGVAKTSGSQDRTSEPSGQELGCSARVSLDRTRMPIDNPEGRRER